MTMNKVYLVLNTYKCKKIPINKHSYANTDRPHRTLYAHDLTRPVMVMKIARLIVL